MSQELTRRDFVKQGTTGIIGFLLGRLGNSKREIQVETDGLQETATQSPSPTVIPESTRTPEPTPTPEIPKKNETDRLNEGNLTEFIPLYFAQRRFREKYGYAPFARVTNILEDVGSGTSVTDELLHTVSEGWNTELDHTEALKKRIDSIKIIDGSAEEITVQRELLRTVSKVLPLHILALPDEMKLVDAGGSMGMHDMTLVTAARNDRYDNAVISLIHESEHAFQMRFETIKKYIPKEKYSEYLTAYLRVIEATLDQWRNLSEEDALSCKYGYPLLAFYLPDKNDIDSHDERESKIHTLTLWEHEFLKESEQEKNLAIGEDWSRRFSRVVFYALRKASDNSLIRNEQIFKECMQEAVEEVSHFFVGPVQSSQGAFPKTEMDVVGGSFLTWQNIGLQQARFAFFSTDFAGQPISKISDALQGPRRVDTTTKDTIETNDWLHNENDVVGIFTVVSKNIPISADTKIRIHRTPGNDPSNVIGAVSIGERLDLYGISLETAHKYSYSIYDGYPYIHVDNFDWVRVKSPNGEIGWIASDFGNISLG